MTDRTLPDNVRVRLVLQPDMTVGAVAKLLAACPMTWRVWGNADGSVDVVSPATGKDADE